MMHKSNAWLKFAYACYAEVATGTNTERLYCLYKGKTLMEVSVLLSFCSHVYEW